MQPISISLIVTNTSPCKISIRDIYRQEYPKTRLQDHADREDINRFQPLHMSKICRTLFVFVSVCILLSRISQSFPLRLSRRIAFKEQRLHHPFTYLKMSSFAAPQVPTGEPPLLHNAILQPGEDSSTAKSNWEEYHRKYRQSIDNPSEFWAAQAQQYLSWFAPFQSVTSGSFLEGDVNWFAGGKLNVCYNCVDRHLEKKADQPAIIWDVDDEASLPASSSPTSSLTSVLTYRQVHQQVCRIANALKAQGVRKGDVVTIYMPMIPTLPLTMLACARIGAVHSIVFAGFSAESLRGRILDCGSKFVCTSEEGFRGGKALKLKSIVDEALEGEYEYECEWMRK